MPTKRTQPAAEKPETDTSSGEVENTPTDRLEDVIEDFNTAWSYTSSSWHKRWRDNYFLYNNQRVSIGYVGISNVFIPMVYSTVETLCSGLFGSKPKFDFIPPQHKQDQATDILNGLLDYYWERDQWSLKVINTGRTMFMLGTAVDYWYWDIDHPVMLNVPLRDFFIDPTATSMEDARWMGRRYLTTVEQLKEYEVVDPKTGDMKPKYSNLDHVHDYKNPDRTDKEEKDMWYGTTLDIEDGQVECIEYWTEDRVITVANRCAVIEDAENYYKAKGKANGNEHAKGLMPFADARDIVDPSLFYAKGTVDFIAGQQEQLNDLTNQHGDSITYTLNQQYTIDPKYPHLQGQVKNLPGATYLAEAGAIQPIQRGQIPPEAFAQIQNIKNEIRETTASNEVIKGANVTGAGDTTATEINAQVAGAGQRLSLKVTQLENGYFHRMARIIFAMIRLYVTEKTMVQIIGKDGAKWEEFDPKEFKDGEYEPRVQLDITVQNKKQEQAGMAKEMLAAFLNDPDVNQQELKKLVLQKGFELDPDEVSVLMTPEPQPMQPPMGALPAGAPQDMSGQMPMPNMGAMPMGAPMPPQQPDMASLAASLPPEILQQLPPDTTPEELQQIADAYAMGSGVPA